MVCDAADRSLDPRPELPQDWQNPFAHCDTGVSEVGVRRIVDKPILKGRSDRSGLLTRKVEKRTDPDHSARIDDHRVHARETFEPGATGQMHQHGFRLIGRGVPQRDRTRVMSTGVLEHRAESGIASPGRQTGSRRQRDPSDLERGPQTLGQFPHHHRLRGRLGTQPMIDVTEHQAQTQPMSHECDHSGQRNRIGPARARHDHGAIFRLSDRGFESWNDFAQSMSDHWAVWWHWQSRVR